MVTAIQERTWVDSDELGIEQDSHQRRGEQWKRLIRVATILADNRNGLTIERLNQELRERFECDISVRTTNRDVRFLESMGLVEYNPMPRYAQQIRWIPGLQSEVRTILGAIALDANKPIKDRRFICRENGGKPRPIIATVDATLQRLPAPWNLSADELKAATEACRVLAIIDSGDASYRDAVLVYRMGDGWTFQRVREDVGILAARSINALLKQAVNDAEAMADRLANKAG